MMQLTWMRFSGGEAWPDICYIHPLKEHRWGQRVVRFYDPDGHIVEVGEELLMVARRFYNSGMTPDWVADRMDVPLDHVVQWLKTENQN